MNYYFLYYPKYYESDGGMEDFVCSFKSLKETIDYLDNYYVQFIAKNFPKYTVKQIEDFYTAMEQYGVKYLKNKKHPAYIKELDILKSNILKIRILSPFIIEYIKPYMHNKIPKHKIEIDDFIGKTPDERDALYRQHIKLRDT